MDILVKLVIVAILILFNAYFVAAEFALVTIRKTRVNELVKKGSVTARYVQTAQKDLYNIISATQLGVTIASLLIGWIGEATVADLLHSVLIFLPKNLQFITIHTLSISFAFIAITYLQIVIGELVPKALALQRTEKTASIIIIPLLIFAKIFSPFIWLLNISASFLMHCLRFSPLSENESVHSEDEITMLLRQSGKQGIIPNNEIKIVQNVFQLNDISVKSVMIPRTEILAFDVTTKLATVIEKSKESQHSRFPVYEGSLDAIIGFIHIKDIYTAFMKKGEKKTISDAKIIRRVIIVPEIKKIDVILDEMRKKRVHMAIVNDEYGGTEGIITLEDIFESLVGEIEDEFEVPSPTIKKHKDGSYRIDGATAITLVEQTLHMHISSQGYITIGGLLFGLLGHEPRINDVVSLDSYTFTVTELEGMKIKTMIATHTD